MMPLLVLMVACREPAGPAAEPDATDCSGAWQPVRDLLDSAVADLDLSGGVVRITVDGRVACIAAAGSLTPQLPVSIQSGSKWLTTATVLSLMGSGLDLDAPIAARLPSFAVKPPITARQVLSQTAGLPADEHCLAHGASLASCVDHIGANVALEAAPGTEFRYGATSFAVAGRLAEVISGRSWAALFARNLAEPLGFTSTTWDSPVLPLLSGGAESSIEDYGRLVEMLAMNGVYRGRRVLPEAAIAAMRQDYTSGLSAVNPPRTGAYGLGSWVESATMSSCPGSFGFLPWVDFERRIGGVVFLPEDLGASWPAAWSIVQRAREIADSLSSLQ